MYKIMTPGPTQVIDNVRSARSLVTTNPDIDLSFCEQYHEICKKISSILGTENETYILSGEGILGLEAACASLTEPEDRVLIIDNGIFGRGFSDFVKIYGGKPVFFTSDYTCEIDVNELEDFLKKDSNFKYATVVHCDTPSGVLNDISKICPLLKKYNIATVVDSVSAMYGNEVQVDKWQIDVLCGASQKALSAPPGLTTITVSSYAINLMKNRKKKIASFYCNILSYVNYYSEKWFPYTMPISDIYGLSVAVDNLINDKEIISRHAKIAKATREAIVKAGLSLYLKSGFSNTVTVVRVPEEINDQQLLNTMRDKYNVMLAGCFDILAGKVFRIGHMGTNANVDDMLIVFDALDNTLRDLGIEAKACMRDVFSSEINK